jgi:hypothetical protein
MVSSASQNCRLRPLVSCALFGAVWFVASAAPAFAQLPQARLYSIFPCGGQVGTSFDVEVTQSADLDEAVRLVFNHPGITAVPKTRDVGGNREPVPNVFTVTIGPKVPTGVYELYAGGLFGLSNPRIFVVGSQPETRESEPNNTLDKANELPLGGIVNGTIGSETDVDVYRFAGKKGTRFVAFCRAADLDSRLAPVLELTDADGRRLGYGRQELQKDPIVDATLPADATYFLKVHDLLYRGGAEYGYRLSAGAIPHIDYIMPPCGVAGSTAKYTLFGRNLPGGKPAGIEVDGRPLEKSEVEITLPATAPLVPAHTTLRSWDAGLGVVSYVAKTPAGESNAVLISLTRVPPVVEREPNDTPQTAQEISVPGEFAGQFQAPGDTDYVTFHAREGQVFWIEVFADRLGSQADPYLVVEQVERNSKGKEVVTRLTAVDDENTNVAPAVFDTRTDDPSYRFRAPADGTYRIVLRDRAFESRGDPRLVYRLSIRPEEPDFQLVVLPQYPKRGTVPAASTWALGLRKGDSRDIEILAIRKDGFREPIEVRAEGLPPGVTCRGSTLAPNAKSGELIFTAAADAPESSGFIHVFGTAKLKGAKDAKEKEIVHEAVPGSIVWSAAVNVPAISRVGPSLALSVMKESAPFQLATGVERLEVNQNRQILLPLKLTRRDGFDGEVGASLMGLAPANLNIQNKPFAKGQSDELLRMFVARGTRPGTYAVYWSLQATVAYRHNVFALERAQREQAAAAKAAQKAAADSKAAVAARDHAIKQQADGTAALKPLRARLAQLEKQQRSARPAAVAEKPKAKPASPELISLAETTAHAADFARKSADELEANARSASVVARPELQARAAAARQLADDLRKNADEAAAKVRSADAPVARSAGEKLVDEIAAAKREVAQAEAAFAHASEAKSQAEAQAKTALAASQQLESAKKAADAKLAQAQQAAAPRSLTDFPASTPLLLTVKAAPMDLSATVAKGGELKRGARLEVKVKVRRSRGFKGAVTLGLPLPPGVVGIRADAVTIPVGKTDGVLTVIADKSAPAGAVANLVVRGAAEFEGRAEVDAPISLKIVP